MRFSLATVAAVASLSGLATAYPWNEDNELYARDVDGSLYAREASSYYGEHGVASQTDLSAWSCDHRAR